MSRTASIPPPANYSTGISCFLDLLFFRFLTVLELAALLLPLTLTLRIPVLELPVFFVSSADLLTLDFERPVFRRLLLFLLLLVVLLLPFNETYSFSMMI